jgi:hypothetical protein
MTKEEMLDAIARDLELCDIGEALTKGATRRRYCQHRKACMAAIAEIDPIPADIAAMSIDDLAKALGV